MPATILDEWVSIGTWVFGTEASHLISLEPLWTPPRWIIPQDAPPAMNGRPARRGRPGPVMVALNAMVFGDFDSEGVAIADYREGLNDNMAAMVAAITPPSTDPYTRTIVHHLPSGTERTAACQAQVFDVVQFSPRALKITLEVTIPSGVWS